MKTRIIIVGLLTTLVLALPGATPARAAKAKAQPQQADLSKVGKQLEAKYSAMLASLKKEIASQLPALNASKVNALVKAREGAEALHDNSDDAAKTAGEAGGISAKIANWKQFWIGKANAGIKKAQADLAAANTDAERDAARKDLAKAEANKADGEKHIAEAKAELEKAKVGQAQLAKASEAAKARLEDARAKELDAAKAILTDIDSFLSSDKLDAKLIKCALISDATPHGLAAFAEKGKAQEAMIDQLLSDDKLMKEILFAGGAAFNKYGEAMEIYTAISTANPKSSEGVLHRLALATALEHAKPINQSNPKDAADNNNDTADKSAADKSGAAAFVDPVKRYQHYKKAYLDGDLDPAFKTLDTWELMLVVNSDASDEMLTWGRETLKAYRPDHILNPNYGWRYSALVKTDVPYGSQNCKLDETSLNNMQNILKDGGVCGRRAFFGRYILRCFGIPVWGVTQHAHAALSHWTPNGWVVNLGAGFNKSWWDKGDVSLDGQDFLITTKARKHPQDYSKIVRAEWVSMILGEQAYNGRKNVTGGTWSSLAHYNTMIVASKEADLGPLGEHLAEANESPESTAKAVAKATVTHDDKKITTDASGVITIPAAACSGKNQLIKSYLGGQQMICGAPFGFAVDVPKARKYTLSVRMINVRLDGQLKVAGGGNSAEVAIPYTTGKWQNTQPAKLSLTQGRNELNFETTAHMALKDITLTPVK